MPTLLSPASCGLLPRPLFFLGVLVLRRPTTPAAKDVGLSGWNEARTEVVHDSRRLPGFSCTALTQRSSVRPAVDAERLPPVGTRRVHLERLLLGHDRDPACRLPIPRLSGNVLGGGKSAAIAFGRARVDPAHDGVDLLRRSGSRRS